MKLSNQSVTSRPKKRKQNPTRAEQASRTRERILKTAVEQFAARGFDGVSVDELVAAAGVNKRMVYHYFGDKAGLYTAALATVYQRLAAAEADVFRGRPSLETALGGVVRAYFQFLRDTPEFVALLLWENLQGGAHLAQAGQALSKAPLLDALDAVIQRGIADGRIRRSIDRRHALIQLIGLCQVYFSNRHTLRHSVGIDLEDPAVLEQGIRSVTRLVKHGLLG